MALEFANHARRLAAAARAEGLVVPAFRSPPVSPNLRRSVRHYAGGWVVGVVIRGREDSEVVADMVAGVLQVNDRVGDSVLHDLLTEAA